MDLIWDRHPAAAATGRDQLVNHRISSACAALSRQRRRIRQPGHGLSNVGLHAFPSSCRIGIGVADQIKKNSGHQARAALKPLKHRTQAFARDRADRFEKKPVADSQAPLVRACACVCA
jgi:hypothetical protein